MTDLVIDATLAAGLGASAHVYLAQRARMVSRHAWSRARTVSFLVGLAMIVSMVVGPAAALADESFFWHALQHVVLGMVAPLLLVLGEPVRLALQNSRAPWRGRLRRVVRGRAIRSLEGGIVPLTLFGGGLVVLYLTPLIRLTTTSNIVHAGVHIHMVAAGALLSWVLVGLDSRLSFPARLLTAVGMIPIHSIIGLTILSENVASGGVPGPFPFAWNALTDQRAGASLLWVSGEFVSLALLALLIRRWAAIEHRAGLRADRLLERDLQTPPSNATR